MYIEGINMTYGECTKNEEIGIIKADKLRIKIDSLKERLELLQNELHTMRRLKKYNENKKLLGNCYKKTTKIERGTINDIELWNYEKIIKVDELGVEVLHINFEFDNRCTTFTAVTSWSSGGWRNYEESLDDEPDIKKFKKITNNEFKTALEYIYKKLLNLTK